MFFPQIIKLKEKLYLKKKSLNLIIENVTGGITHMKEQHMLVWRGSIHCIPSCYRRPPAQSTCCLWPGP